MQTDTPPSQPSGSRKTIWSWAMYDFANSAFTTLVVTFIYATYFVKGIAVDEIAGTVQWSRAVTLSAIIIAVLAPIMGAMADQGGYRRRYLMIMTAISVFATTMLYFPQHGDVTQALVWFMIANVGFEVAIVFYNAYLPNIAPPDKIGNVSGFGWGMGYVGGLGAMFLAMVTLVNPEVPWFGFSREAGENIRATNLLVAVWFALFSIPAMISLKDPVVAERPKFRENMVRALAQLRATFRQIRTYREVAKLLLARLIYNDGLTTIFAFGGIYAAGTFGFTFEEIMIFGIVLNVAAGLGAFILGPLDDRYGGKKIILLSIVGLTIAAVIALIATSKTHFWISGIMVGLFAGPCQSASRSLMARFTPEHLKNEFFGFYALSGKATAFLGPLVLGILVEIFQSQRAGLSVVVILFVIGAALLLKVDEAAGINIRNSSQNKN